MVHCHIALLPLHSFQQILRYTLFVLLAIVGRQRFDGLSLARFLDLFVLDRKFCNIEPCCHGRRTFAVF